MAFNDYVKFKRKTIEDKEKLVFDDGYVEPVTPTGKKTITGTAEVNVAAYATAQVVDSNLKAANIKKGVTILGVEGTYEA